MVLIKINLGNILRKIVNLEFIGKYLKKIWNVINISKIRLLY